MWKFKFTANALKVYKKLVGEWKQRVDDALKSMLVYYNQEHSELPKPDLKALHGRYQGLIRMVVGKYRIIFKINNKVLEILVVEIDKRGDIY